MSGQEILQAQLIWQEKRILHRRQGAVNSSIPFSIAGFPDGATGTHSALCKGTHTDWHLAVCLQESFTFIWPTNIWQMFGWGFLRKMTGAPPLGWLDLENWQDLGRSGWVKEKCQLMRSEDLRTATCHLLGGWGGGWCLKRMGEGQKWSWVWEGTFTLTLSHWERRGRKIRE